MASYRWLNYCLWHRTKHDATRRELNWNQRNYISHWLRVPEHISYKLAVLTFQSIHSTSPSYLQWCFTRVADMTSGRRLWSSTSYRLEVPLVRLSGVDKRALPVAGGNVWNDLLFQVTSAQSLTVFRQCLKTFLFSRSYPDILLIIMTLF